MDHFKVVCSACLKVLAKCSCTDCDRSTTYGMCNGCIAGSSKSVDVDVAGWMGEGGPDIKEKGDK